MTLFLFILSIHLTRYLYFAHNKLSTSKNIIAGENRDGKLTIERFLEFQTDLQREILRLEFERKHPDEDTNLITEAQFAELLLAYADYNTKKRSGVIKRVRKAYKKKKNKEQDKQGNKIITSAKDDKGRKLINEILIISSQ